MKKLVPLITALILLSPLSAVASDWQFTTETKEQWYYIDFSSIVNVKNYRKAWVREDSTKDRQTNDYPTKNYRSGKFLYYFDCNGRRIGSVQKILYDKMFGEGEVVQTVSIKFTDEVLSEVAPDSIGETLLDVACSSPSERAKVKAKNKANEDAVVKAIKELPKS